MNKPPKNLGELVSPQSSERLDSWKEIASHLDRSVRTVRRWEENESLPVRRHYHGKGSTVFALKSELDAWLTERFESPRSEPPRAESSGAESSGAETVADKGAVGPAAQEPPGSAGAGVRPAGDLPGRAGSATGTRSDSQFESQLESRLDSSAGWPHNSPSRSRRDAGPGSEFGGRGASASGLRSRLLAWGVVATLAAMLAGAFIVLPQRARELPQVSKPMARVLVSEVDVVDSDEISADVVASLLRREFGRSSVFELMSRDEVEATLRLMRVPIGSPLDAATARRVSWRTPKVDALIVPRVERVGRHYLVDLDLVEPTRGTSVTHLSEPFDSIDDLISAVRGVARKASQIVASRHSGQVRRENVMPRVTTRSEEALRIYSEADQLRRSNRVVAAERLLRSALAEDPEFVSAYLQLAWSLYEQGREPESIREVLALATRHVMDVSAEEQLFLQASLDFFESRPSEALSTFDALLTLSPDHYWGNRTAGTLCWASDAGGARDCLRYPIRMAEAAPDNAQANFAAAWSLALWSDAPGRAQPYIDRARGLVAADSDLVTPLERARIELFSVYESWLAGESAQVVAEQERVASRFDEFGLDVQDVIARELGYLSLALGRISDAESWFRRLPDPAARHEALATLVFAQDDPEALARHLKEGAGYRDPMTPLLFSMAGLKSESETLLARLQDAGVEDHYLGLGRGLNAMMGGEVDVAIEEFHASVAHLRPDHRGLFFAGADLLAVAFSKQGDLRRAVASLETVAGHRRRAAYMGSGVFWMKCQLRLAGFYREIGREKDAQQIETQLLGLLSAADEDYPMRVRLEALVG